MADEAADEHDGEAGRPRTASLVAGAVVVVVALVVGVALLVNSDIDVGRLLGTDDRHELDVALVGDSFADQSRAAFVKMADRRDLEVEVHAYGGTSICSWDEQLRRLADEEPDTLVLSFAGNDLQPCINPRGTPTRDPVIVAAEYRQQLEEVIELFRPTGTDLYVVNPPPIRDPQFEANAEAMREMYRSASIFHPRITVIETEDRLGPDGAFHRSLPCEAVDRTGDCRGDGTVVLRQGDGIHLTPAGGRRYAAAIFDTLTRGA